MITGSITCQVDDRQTPEEDRSARLGEPMVRRVVPVGDDPRRRPEDDLRWSRFKHMAPAEVST
jgi:type I restriction enzyme M protein